MIINQQYILEIIVMFLRIENFNSILSDFYINEIRCESREKFFNLRSLDVRDVNLRVDRIDEGRLIY